MAKVILDTNLANADRSWAVGDEYECDEAEARRMIDQGYARAPGAGGKAAKAALRETATAPAAPEKADG